MLRRSGIIIVIFSTVLTACATFRIPAPKVPVEPMPEPVIEKSTITVPINIALGSAAEKLGKLFSRNKDKIQDLTRKLDQLLDNDALFTDEQLMNNFYVKYSIGKAWEALQNPIRLNYNLSLYLNPESVQISPPTRDGRNAQIVAAVIAKPQLVTSDTQQLAPVPSSLPNFSITRDVPEQGFHIELDNEFSFKQIGAELTKKLSGKNYTVAGKNIVIEELKVSAAGQALVIAIKVKGTARGTLYVSGIPSYDASNMVLLIKDVDYTLETRNVLAKSADWLLHSGLQEAVAKNARWDLKEKLTGFKDTLSEALNRKINRYVKLRGKIQRLKLAALGITQTSVKAVLVTDGIVELDLF